MLQSVDEDEKVVNNVYTPGGVQNSWFLTENGLYEVLMLSRKPKAKDFKKKVKEILKTIRKTGGGRKHIFVQKTLVPISHLKYSYIIKIRRRNQHEKESQKISGHSSCCNYDILTSTFSISGN